MAYPALIPTTICGPRSPVLQGVASVHYWMWLKHSPQQNKDSGVRNSPSDLVHANHALYAKGLGSTVALCPLSTSRSDS